MVSTISNIGTEISLIISKTSSVSTISEQERINNFLNSINKLKVSLNNRVEKLKQNTRRFAKRQLTWFRNRMAVKFYNVSEADFKASVTSDVDCFLNDKKL